MNTVSDEALLRDLVEQLCTSMAVARRHLEHLPTECDVATALQMIDMVQGFTLRGAWTPKEAVAVYVRACREPIRTAIRDIARHLHFGPALQAHNAAQECVNFLTECSNETGETGVF